MRRWIVALAVLVVALAGCSRGAGHPAPTPVGPPPVPVPARVLGGFLEGWIPLLPREVPAQYNVVFICFAEVNRNGSLKFQIDQDDQALIQDIANYRAKGEPVILGIGGADGAKSGLQSKGEQRQFLASLYPLIDKYGFSGIEWDLEDGVDISVPGLAATTRDMIKRYGRDFSIWTAPYTQTNDVYKQLTTELPDVPTIVMFQFYNDDEVPTSEFVLREMSSWLTQTRISPDRFTLGFMASDDAGKVTPYPTMVEITRAVQEKYPTVRGVWVWALGADQATDYAFARTLAPVVR